MALRKTPASSTSAARNLHEAETRFSTLGFGGFSGSQQVTGVDEEMVPKEAYQYCKQLLKKNTTTKLKALQSLEDCMKEMDVVQLRILFPKWMVCYRSLVRDLDKSIRLKSTELLQSFVVCLKRDLAPFLKLIMGPWWIAQHDEAARIKMIAQDCFQSAFTGQKSHEAVVFCGRDLMKYLCECLEETLETISDPKKESKEEREFRLLLLHRAALPGTSHLLIELSKSSKADLKQELLVQLGHTLLKKALLKRLFASPMDDIRSESYHLLQEYCKLAKEEVQAKIEVLGPMVLNSVIEKDPSSHPYMWKMIFTWIQTIPQMWNTVSLEKTVWPKICSLLRRRQQEDEDYDGFLLVFLGKIPSEKFNQSPGLVIKLFKSAWEGLSARHLQTVNKFCWELIIWGLCTQDSRFLKEILEQIFKQTIFPALISQMNLCESLLGQLIGKLTLMVVGDHPERLHVLKEVLDCVLLELMSRLGQEAIPTMIEDLMKGICSCQGFSKAAKDLLYEEFGKPLGQELTKAAFSKNPSSSCVSCLLGASKALEKSILTLEKDKTDLATEHSIILFHKIQEVNKKDVDVGIYFDLLVYCLLESSLNTRRQQWDCLLESVETGLEQDSVQWNRLFFLLLSSISKVDPIPELRLSKLPDLWQLNSGSLQLLIKLRRSLLDGELFAELLSDLLNRDPEVQAPLAGVLFESGEVQEWPENIKSTWIKLIVQLVSYAWKLGPSPAKIHINLADLWNKGRILSRLDEDLRVELTAELEQKTKEYVCADPDPHLASSMISEILSWTPKPDKFISTVFLDGAWCQWWWSKNLKPTIGKSNNFLSILCSLLKTNGPDLLNPQYSLSPVLLMELLCQPHLNPEVLNSVLDYLVELQLEGKDTLGTQFLSRCIINLNEAPEEIHNYSAALQAFLIALEHASDQTKILPFLEKFISELISSLEFPLSPHLEETLTELLPHVVPGLRTGSLYSVDNANLQKLSTYCLQEYSSRGSLPAKGLELCMVCFPVLSDMTDWLLYATPDEREALIALLDSNEIEIWKRIVAYCFEDLTDSDWSILSQKLLTHYKQKIQILEEICEDLSGLSLQLSQEISPLIQSPFSAIHFLDKLIKSCPNSFPTLSTKVDELISQWRGEEIPTVELLQGNFILLQLLEYHQLVGNIQESQSLSLRLVFCLGISLLTGRLLSPKLVLHLHEIFAVSHGSWIWMVEVFDRTLEETSAAQELVEGIEMWSEATGVDTLSCLLELISAPHLPESLKSCCLKLIVVSDHCFESLVMEEEEVPEEGLEEIHSLLVSAGLHWRLARVLESGEIRLISWSLLLTNLVSKGSKHWQRFSTVVRGNPSLFDEILSDLVPLLPLPETNGKKLKSTEEEVIKTKEELLLGVMKKKDFSLKEFLLKKGLPQSDMEWQVLAVKLYQLILEVLPVSLRLWFSHLTSRTLSHSIESYTMLCESPQLIQKQLSLIPSAGMISGEMKVKTVPAKKEVIASLQIDEEETIELFIKLPSSLPLRNITVNWNAQVNVQKSSLQRKLFAVSTFLKNHSGPVTEAIGLWKESLEEFFGRREKCLICFCVIHPHTRETPDKCCKTCKLEFHSTCLYSWFRQSSKSICPHCQTPWTA